MLDGGHRAIASDDVMPVELRLLTTLLDALYGGARDSPVNSLGSVLDGLDGALASNGGGGEQASLAGDLGAEHDDVWSGYRFVDVKVVKLTEMMSIAVESAG